MNKNIIQLRMNDADKEIITTAAEHLGLPISAYLRMTGLKYARAKE